MGQVNIIMGVVTIEKSLQHMPFSKDMCEGPHMSMIIDIQFLSYLENKAPSVYV